MTLILQEVARDHGLNSRALVGKYVLRGQKELSPVTLKTYPAAHAPPLPEGIPSVPVAPVVSKGKKGGRKPKFSTPPPLDGTLTRSFMEGLTIPLLKEACKMCKVAITGSKDTLIDRMLSYQSDPGAHQPPRKGGRKKKVQFSEPTHNHPLDSHTHPDCEQCKAYGNPMDPGMQEEVFEVTHDAPVAPEVPKSPVAPEVPKSPEAPDSSEFEIDDGDIEDQLKAIVAQMNTTCLDGDDLSDVESDVCDDDPFDQMDYGDDLEEED